MSTSWIIQEGQNDGYPLPYGITYTIIDGWTNGVNDVYYPALMWRITEGVNEGYPYTWWMIAVQSGYINDPGAVIGSDADMSSWISDDDGFDGTGSDTGDLETHIRSGLLQGGHWYVISGLDLYNLTNWLNTTYKPDAEQLTQDFKGVNPSDYIISVKYYPFNIDGKAAAPVTLGGLSTGITAPTLDRDYGRGQGYFDLGSFTFKPPYIAGNWTDNYNKILLYIPWCGYAELDPATYCQSPDNSYNTVSVKMQIDYATGACTAFIYRNATMMDSLSGTVGVDIPLSAVSQGSYQNAIKQAEIAVKQSKLGQISAYGGLIGSGLTAAAGALTLNPVVAAAGAVGVVSSATSAEKSNLNVESAEYTLSHTAPHVGNIESAAPYNGCISDQTAKIYILRPAMLQGTDLTTYGKTVGFACCKSGKLSDFHGLTICSNVKLDNLNAPSHHKAAIAQALIKGVYLP